MARSPWLAPIAVLLAVLMLVTGCASAAPRDVGDGATNVTSTEDGAQKAHGGDLRGAIVVLAFVLLVVTVFVDLLTLPCTIPAQRPFCCTEGVVFVIYR